MGSHRGHWQEKHAKGRRIAQSLATGRKARHLTDSVAGLALFPLTPGMMPHVIASALIPATLAALFQTIEAPFGVLWVWIGTGEVSPVTTNVGAALVVSGVCGRLFLEPERDAS
jgi:hypothetical protein